MSIIAPDGWYDLAKRLPKGLNGALKPGGREDGNGIIPTKSGTGSATCRSRSSRSTLSGAST